MAKLKEEKKEPKIKVEKIGSPKTKKENPAVIKFEKLQKEAFELGMPKEDIEKFRDMGTLEAAVNSMKAIKADKIVSLEENADPKEEKETEKHWTSKADRQKAYFDSRPKVRILIPCEGDEKPGVVEEKEVNGRLEMVAVSGAIWSKTFNGYRVIVPKGVYTEVSEAVADNIADEFNQVQKSNAQFSIERIDPKTGKPVREQL
jgi:hypothetical protein